LPTLPLSKYYPEKLPEHRAIIIGQHDKINEILQGNCPIEFYHDELMINKKIVSTDTLGFFYALSCSPKEQSNLKLAMLLSAENNLGIQALTKHYTKGTALFDEACMKIWSLDETLLVNQGEITF
jgi:hypothetical protein